MFIWQIFYYIVAFLINQITKFQVTREHDISEISDNGFHVAPVGTKPRK